MAQVYVAPVVNTHDAARKAASDADFAATCGIAVAVAAAKTVAVSALHVAAKAVAAAEQVSETAAQRAKGKV